MNLCMVRCVSGLYTRWPSFGANAGLFVRRPLRCYNVDMNGFLSRLLGRPDRPDPLSPALRRQLEASPQALVRVIVRTEGDAEMRRSEAEALGLRVHRVFKLTPGLAVEGTAEAIVRLATRSWVASIEVDCTVHTMPEKGD